MSISKIIQRKVIEYNCSQFKKLCDPIDQRENEKYLIEVRQFIKHNSNIKWRNCKLRWVEQLIKSLETTTKSHGNRTKEYGDDNYD